MLKDKMEDKTKFLKNITIKEYFNGKSKKRRISCKPRKPRSIS